MDPTTQFCHNLACSQRGQVGHGNIGVQSKRDRRSRCKVCGTTFSATKGTPSYRLHTAVEMATLVLTLLCHGCPLQAIVVAFGLDERTVAAWQARAGQHCHAVHEHLVAAGQVDVQHVQADELWVKLVRKRVWRAMALAVPSRLWLGGVVSEHRDLTLIVRVVQLVRRCAMTAAMLVCVDALSSYVTAFRRVFRQPIQTGHQGRPRLGAEPGLLLAQVVKQDTQRHVVSVSRRVVQGSAEGIAAVLATSHRGKEINTAYIERLKATFRSALTPLTRRGRALVHTDAVLTAGMYVVGSAYNFCWVQASLRQLAPTGSALKWRERTPAMAAGLTDHCWTMSDLLHDQVPLPLGVAPKRRGRPPKASQRSLTGAAA